MMQAQVRLAHENAALAQENRRLFEQNMHLREFSAFAPPPYARPRGWSDPHFGMPPPYPGMPPPGMYYPDPYMMGPRTSGRRRGKTSSMDSIDEKEMRKSRASTRASTNFSNTTSMKSDGVCSVEE